ncbi:hypothetical protein K1X76_07720 [bacterium]|nr:hypothetical protein [bacterium]
MTTFNFNIDTNKINFNPNLFLSNSPKVTPETFFKEYSGILKEGIQKHFDPDFITQKLFEFSSQHPQLTKLFNLPTTYADTRNQIVKPSVDTYNFRLQNMAGAAQSPTKLQTFGDKLAFAATTVATDMSSKGKCYRGVKSALYQMGINLKGYAAYQAKDQLLASPKFKTLDVAAEDLNKLPAGSIVVWDKSPQKPYGHISIALGNGQEASDHIQNQITNGNKYGGYTVFIPQ